MINVVAVGLGGSLGAMLRYGVGVLFQNAFMLHPLFSTFTVNFVGCFLIGFLAEIDFKSAMYIKYFLIAGLLGGFTTYSAFSLETLTLFKAANHLKAACYISATLVLCLLAVYLGASLYKALN